MSTFKPLTCNLLLLVATAADAKIKLIARPIPKNPQTPTGPIIPILAYYQT